MNVRLARFMLSRLRKENSNDQKAPAHSTQHRTRLEGEKRDRTFMLGAAQAPSTDPAKAAEPVATEAGIPPERVLASMTPATMPMRCRRRRRLRAMILARCARSWMR